MLWVVAMALFAANGVVAQEAAFVARYAESESVTGVETAYLLSIATGLASPGDPFDAQTVQESAPQRVRDLVTQDPLTLGEFSFLLTTYFEITDGLMGRLFPGPRYALRDLRRERVLFFRADAGSPVPGETALRTIRRAAALEASS